MRGIFALVVLLPSAMATISRGFTADRISRDLLNVPMINSLLNDLVTEQIIGENTFKCTEFTVKQIESTFGPVVDNSDGQSVSLNVIFSDISASCDNDLLWNTAKLNASIDFFFSDFNTSIPNKIATSESFDCESLDAASFIIDLSLEGSSAEDIEVFRKNVCSAIKGAVTAQVDNYNQFPLEPFLPVIEPEFEDVIKQTEEFIASIIPDGFDFVSPIDLLEISNHLLCSFGKSKLYNSLFGNFLPGSFLCMLDFSDDAPLPDLRNDLPNNFPFLDLRDDFPNSGLPDDFLDFPGLSEIVSQLNDELFPSLLPPGVEIEQVYEIFEVDPSAGGNELQTEINRVLLNVRLGIEDGKFLFTNPLHSDDVKFLKFVVLLDPSTADVLNQVIADESFESIAPLFTYRLEVSEGTELIVEVSSFAVKNLNLGDLIVSEGEEFEFFSKSFIMPDLILREVIVDVEGKVAINKEGNEIQEESFQISVAMSGQCKSSVTFVVDKAALMDLDLSTLENVPDAIQILNDAMKHVGLSPTGLEFDVATSLDNFEFEVAEPFFLDSATTILEMIVKGIPPYVSKLDAEILSMVDELFILSIPSEMESSRTPIYILVGIVGFLALITVIFAVRRNQVQPNTSEPNFSPEQPGVPTKKEFDAVNLA